jgi:hypothetical protein
MKDQPSNMNDLLAKIYKPNYKEIDRKYYGLKEFHGDECSIETSTGFMDCIFLYILALYHNPNVVFEAGTFVGSTAKFLAEGCGLRKECVHTCEPYWPQAYYSSVKHDESIIRYQCDAQKLIKYFKKENQKVDMALFDIGEAEPSEMLEILDIASDRFVFVCTDFYDDKYEPSTGSKNIYPLFKSLSSKGYNLILPELGKWPLGHFPRLHDGVSNWGINGRCAVLIPPCF